jgi:hypothetical protein
MVTPMPIIQPMLVAVTLSCVAVTVLFSLTGRRRLAMLTSYGGLVAAVVLLVGCILEAQVGVLVLGGNGPGLAL